MAAQPITQIKTENTELFHPSIEVIRGTTQSTEGDYWNSKKFSIIDAAFASQETTDSVEIKVSWSGAKVTVVPESAIVTLTLTIFGRM